MSEHTTPPERSEHTPTEQPVFGMKRAAEIAGISVSTIRRNKSRLEECGAEISPDGWRVPISALVASGLMKSTTPGDNYPEPEKVPQIATQSHSEVRELERQIMELKHRAELAEERQRSAEERARAARELADALSETLSVERRMLTTSSPTLISATEQSTVSPSSQQQPLPKASNGKKRGWIKFFSRRDDI